MNSVLAQSQSLLSRTDVLNGGKAPRYWKRDLSRETDRLATVLQICDWVKTVANARPSFFQKPLFGDCLAEITSGDVLQSDETTTQVAQGTEELRLPAFGSRARDREIIRTTSSEPHRQRRRRQTVSATPGVSDLSQELDPPAGTFTLRPQGDDSGLTQRRSRSAKVSQLPPQGDALLLKRLAGRSVDSLKEKPNSSNPLSSLRQKRAPALSSVSITTLHDKDLRHLVACRAAKTWLRDWPAARMPVSTSPASLPAPWKAPTSERSAGSLLEEQWATPLFGQMAAPEILDHLAKQSGMNGGPHVSEILRSKRDSPGNGDSIPARSQFFNQSPAGAKRVSSNEEVNRGAKPFEDIFPERDRLIIPETRRAFNSQAQPLANTGERLRSSHGFAAPALTPSLPQLLPAAGPGAVVPPVAADTALRRAWRDEVNAQEKDLSVLAAQLKRILDEEARRHGIDV
jgi:hypothetical protein